MYIIYFHSICIFLIFITFYRILDAPTRLVSGPGSSPPSPNLARESGNGHLGFPRQPLDSNLKWSIIWYNLVGCLLMVGNNAAGESCMMIVAPI